MLKNENVRLQKNNKTEFDITFYLKGNKVLVESHQEAQKYYPSISDAVQTLLYKNRIAVVTRNTKETQISVKINLDGKGKSKISTGIGFFDHMIEQISRHGNIDLDLKVKGDLHVDEHHTVEDTGIAIGEAIRKALGDKIGIKRYGFMLPMDESFAKCAIDLGGRVYLNFKCKFDREKVGEFPTELCREFFKGMSMGLNANILVEAKGENDHHKIEAMFKAFAKSLNEACRFDERAAGTLPTTKGII
ncbi:MAG: imidazoleglycerol-phosphate dehydratase HisB [Melioribacteraceae bacterium]|nr:imidazoleglycerol-phosphate dehydratase HisB [Melioribacteraceae bacterium]